MSFLDTAIKASNRVSVIEGFIADDSATKSEMIAEAFRITQEPLFEISQAGQSDEVARFLDTQNGLVSEQHWPAFVATQIGILHQANVLQKTIEEVGDDFSNWKAERVSANTFMAAMRGLEFLLMFDPDNQIDDWTKLPSADCCQRVKALGRTLCGLTLIAINDCVVDEVEAFTGTNYAANLIVSAARQLTI